MVKEEILATSRRTDMSGCIGCAHTILKSATHTVNTVHLCVYQDGFPEDVSQVS